MDYMLYHIEDCWAMLMVWYYICQCAIQQNKIQLSPSLAKSAKGAMIILPESVLNIYVAQNKLLFSQVYKNYQAVSLRAKNSRREFNGVVVRRC